MTPAGRRPHQPARQAVPAYPVGPPNPAAMPAHLHPLPWRPLFGTRSRR